jgi:hypothetical protein
MRRHTAIAMILLGSLTGALLHPSAAAAGPAGLIRGVVLDHATRAPVVGAMVTLPAYGVGASSGPDGSFQFADPLATDTPYRRIEATVTAPGFGRWTIRGVPLYPGDTLVLRAELRSRNWDHQVLTPAERGGRARTGAPNIELGNTCSGWNYENVPPPTIKVWRSEEGVSEEYDYYFYVTHVLPNEWIASWDEDALGAGAVAAKTYAAYRTMSGHAYSEGEDCADVIDTVADQVFDPSWSHENTDQAVYAAMGSILYRDGGLFLSQYWAGDPDDPCAPVEEGQYAGRMSQWGTQTCALEGEYWPNITTIFYQDTNWRYRENLLLDSSAESEATYPWEWTGTLERLDGNSYHKRWHWRLEPPVGQEGAFKQTDPFLGDGGTVYHAEWAVKCPRGANETKCTFRILVVVFQENGKSHQLEATYEKTRDGNWGLFQVDLGPHGFVHAKARLSIRSEQVLMLDDARLWSSFGGP